jgi:hypothetical protein
MLGLPSMTDESARLAALRGLRESTIRLPEQAFDDPDVCSLARSAGRPFALITLVDADRQWFKSRVGILDERNLARDILFARAPSSNARP